MSEFKQGDEVWVRGVVEKVDADAGGVLYVRAVNGGHVYILPENARHAPPEPEPKKAAEEPKTELGRVLRLIRDRIVADDRSAPTIEDFDAAIAELERRSDDDE